MTERPVAKRSYRFSIAAILFLMLCVAGVLTGYRVGFHQGYMGGEQQRQIEEPFPKAYAVADLVTPKHADTSTTTPDFDSLIETITSNVDYDTWDEVGGPGTISVMPSNQTLIITQTNGVHERIEDLLTQMREPRLQREVDE